MPTLPHPVPWRNGGDMSKAVRPGLVLAVVCLFAPAVLEQQQTVVVGRFDVPFRRGAGIQRFGLLQVFRHPAP